MNLDRLFIHSAYYEMNIWTNALKLLMPCTITDDTFRQRRQLFNRVRQSYTTDVVVCFFVKKKYIWFYIMRSIVFAVTFKSGKHLRIQCFTNNRFCQGIIFQNLFGWNISDSTFLLQTFQDSCKTHSCGPYHETL